MVLLLQPSWACEMGGNYWIRGYAEACPPALGFCWPLRSERPPWNVLRVADCTFGILRQHSVEAAQWGKLQGEAEGVDADANE